MTTPQQPANLPASVNAADLKRDLQATLAARRELGPEYDEHFLNALVEKMTAIQQAQQPRAQPPAKKSPPHDQQLALAICSLIFGIPIIGIGVGTEGMAGLVITCLMIIGLNLFFDRQR